MSLTYAFPYLEPVCCSMSGSNFCFLACIQAVLRRQVRSSGIPISLRSFQFLVIHIVKGFSIVNEGEVDFFFFLFNSIALSIIQRRLGL